MLKTSHMSRTAPGGFGVTSERAPQVAQNLFQLAHLQHLNIGENPHIFAVASYEDAGVCVSGLSSLTHHNLESIPLGVQGSHSLLQRFPQLVNLHAWI